MPEVQNFVELQPGQPRVMRFDAHAWQDRQIKDPSLGFNKTVRALVFHVTEVDGAPADTVFSVLAVGLQKEFEPYLERERYRSYRFTVLKGGAGFSMPRIAKAELA